MKLPIGFLDYNLNTQQTKYNDLESAAWRKDG